MHWREHQDRAGLPWPGSRKLRWRWQHGEGSQGRRRCTKHGRSLPDHLRCCRMQRSTVNDTGNRISSKGQHERQSVYPSEVPAAHKNLAQRSPHCGALRPGGRGGVDAARPPLIPIVRDQRTTRHGRPCRQRMPRQPPRRQPMPRQPAVRGRVAAEPQRCAPMSALRRRRIFERTLSRPTKLRRSWPTRRVLGMPSWNLRRPRWPAHPMSWIGPARLTRWPPWSPPVVRSQPRRSRR